MDTYLCLSAPKTKTCRSLRRPNASGRTVASKVSLKKNPIPDFALMLAALSPARDSQVFLQWGPPPSASVRAQQETETTSDNERLLRTFHPNLAKAKVVYLASLLFTRDGVPYNERFWVTSRDRTPGVTAGGLDIHLLPAGYPMDMTITPMQPQIEERLSILWRDINPRKVLTEEDLAALRRLFPRSIGAQVLISGRLRVLFKTLEDIKETQKDGYFQDIGGLVVLLDKQTAQRPPDHRKLHPYREREKVSPPKRKGMLSQAKNWMGRVKKALIDGRKKDHKSKDKGKAPANRLSYTSDNSGRKLLSPVLKRFGCSPLTPLQLSPSSPLDSVEKQWPSYARILSGAPIYALSRLDRYHVKGKKLSDLTGYAKAVLLGTQYLWNHETHAQKVSLIWWISGGSDAVENFPNLCLGGPNNDIAELILLQDYEIGLRMWEFTDGHSRMAPVKVANLFSPDEIPMTPPARR